MKEVTWNVVFDRCDQRGGFTHQIKWNPPNNSGFIVQYIEVDDPIKAIRNYKKPYYEAWKVENGIVLHEGNGSEEYDDSFSNEDRGDFPIQRQRAIDAIQTAMEKAEINETYICYNCCVYWVEKYSNIYLEINKWRKGVETGISMARELRASYIKPRGLEKGRNRFYKATFKRQS